MQVRLLRVCRTEKIQRVGSNVREKVNVRVVAATSRNLYPDGKEGRVSLGFVLSFERCDPASAFAAGTEGGSSIAHPDDSQQNLKRNYKSHRRFRVRRWIICSVTTGRNVRN